MPPAPRPLWTCPECGHPFVNRNQAHSCGRFSLDAHFAGCDPAVRASFDRFAEMARACGPVVVEPQKTRIVFVVRVRFGGATTARRWLNARLWLRRQAAHPLLRGHESYGALGWGNLFRVTRPEELDDDFAALVREAYAIGRGEG